MSSTTTEPDLESEKPSRGLKRASWQSRWAKKGIKFIKHPVLVFFGGILGGIILLGSSIDALPKILSFPKLFDQAKQDTDAIATFRKQLEEQHQFLTMAVRDSNKAREDIARIDEYATTARKKADEAENAARQANISQKELSRLSDFNMLLTRANNDDRAAFDKLMGMANNGDQPFKKISSQAIISIVSNRGLTLGMAESDWPKFNFDPEKATLSEYEIFMGSSRPDLQGSALSAMWEQERFGKLEKLRFLITTIKATPSIRVLEDACRIINQEAKIDKNILAWSLYVEWWDAHSLDYK